MSIKVMTDGSNDVPKDAVEQYDITIVHPLVIIGGKSYISHEEISLDEFFEQQRTSPVLPSTSQPAPGQFVEAFERALETHDQVLYIGVSSGLSGTINSAQQAASDFPEGKIVIHDTRTITAAGGLQAVAAARVVANGGTMEEALEAARRTHQEAQFFFTVEDLTFLIKGGRIGRVAGAVGSLLNIKPIIFVDREEGVFTPGQRVRSFKAAVRKLVDMAADHVGEGQPGRFVVLYGTMEEEAAELAETLKERFDVRYLRQMRVAPTLAAHTGPRAMGIVAARGDW